MSDARLRELERRWKETGSPDDEAAYLLERVRVGDLTRDRLELAAFCGHEGSIRAVGSDETSAPSDEDTWIEALLDRWPEWGRRVALAAVRHAAGQITTRSTAPETAMAAVASFLDCPCEEHRLRASLAAEAIPYGFTPLPTQNLKMAARAAALSVSLLTKDQPEHYVRQALFHTQLALKPNWAALAQAIRHSLLERVLANTALH